MKLSKNVRPEMCVSKDSSRQHLAHTYLHADDGVLVSTDGHRLLVVPVEVEEHDAPGFVSADAIKAARKAAPKKDKLGKPNDSFHLQCNGACVTPEGTSYPRPAKDETPPPYMAVVTSFTSEDSFTVGINAKYLLEAAKAIGSADGHIRLTIKHDSDGLHPLRVDPATPVADGMGAFCIVMPIRI